MTAGENRNQPPPGGGSGAAERLPAFPGPNKRKTGRRLAVALLVLALAAVVWHASQRVPTGRAKGGRLVPPGAAAALKKTIRIGTFNIRAGRGTDRRLDLKRTAKSLAGLDLVGLNEVAGRWPWQAADQAELLGRITGQAYLFAPFERRWYCYEFGNGLLSSLPVWCWVRLPLSGPTDRPRNVLIALVEHGQPTISVVIAHAARRDPPQRDRELKEIVNDFLVAAPAPAVLLGDLNAGPDHPVLAKLVKTPGVVDALAGAPGVPSARIDWILLRGLRAVRAGMVDQGASDHPLFWAEVELAPGVQ